MIENECKTWGEMFLVWYSELNLWMLILKIIYRNCICPWGHSFSTNTNFSKKKKNGKKFFSFLENFYIRTKWMIHFYNFRDFLQFYILMIILKGNSFDGKFASFIWNKNMNRVAKSLIMFIRWNSKVEVNWWPNICF